MHHKPISSREPHHHSQAFPVRGKRNTFIWTHPNGKQYQVTVQSKKGRKIHMDLRTSEWSTVADNIQSMMEKKHLFTERGLGFRRAQVTHREIRVTYDKPSPKKKHKLMKESDTSEESFFEKSESISKSGKEAFAHDSGTSTTREYETIKEIFLGSRFPMFGSSTTSMEGAPFSTKRDQWKRETKSDSSITSEAFDDLETSSQVSEEEKLVAAGEEPVHLRTSEAFDDLETSSQVSEEEELVGTEEEPVEEPAHLRTSEADDDWEFSSQISEEKEQVTTGEKPTEKTTLLGTSESELEPFILVDETSKLMEEYVWKQIDDLKEENKILQNELNSLREKWEGIKEIVKRSEGIDINIEDVGEEPLPVPGTIETGEIDELKKAKQFLIQENLKQMIELQNLQHDYEKLLEDLKKIQGKKEELETMFQEVLEGEEAFRQQAEDLKGKLESQGKELEDLISERAEQQKQIAALTQALEKAEQVGKNLNFEKESAEAKIQDLEDLLATLRETAKKWEQVESIVRRYGEGESVIPALEEDRKKLEEQAKEIERLKEVLEKARTTAEEAVPFSEGVADVDISGYEERIDQLEKQLTDANQQNEELTKTFQEEVNRLGSREMEEDLLKKLEGELLGEINALKGQIKGLKDENQSLAKERDRLSQHIEEELGEDTKKDERIAELKGELERNQAEIKRANEKISGLEDEVEGLDGEKKRLAEKLNGAKNRAGRAQKEITELQKEIADLKKELSGAESVMRKEIEDLKPSLIDIGKREAQEELVALRKNVESLKRDLQEKENQLAVITSEVKRQIDLLKTSYTDEIERLENNLKQREEELEEIQASQEKGKEKDEEIAALREANQELYRRIDELERDYDTVLSVSDSLSETTILGEERVEESDEISLFSIYFHVGQSDDEMIHTLDRLFSNKFIYNDEETADFFEPEAHSRVGRFISNLDTKSIHETDIAYGNRMAEFALKLYGKVDRKQLEEKYRTALEEFKENCLPPIRKASEEKDGEALKDAVKYAFQEKFKVDKYGLFLEASDFLAGGTPDTTSRPVRTRIKGPHITGFALKLAIER